MLPLRQGTGVGIIHQAGGQVQAAPEKLHNRNRVPTRQIRRGKEDTPFGVHRISADYSHRLRQIGFPDKFRRHGGQLPEYMFRVSGRGNFRTTDNLSIP